jgi:hypothetical protein
MKTLTMLVLLLCLIALDAQAIDFLGVELCDGSTDTSVRLPPGSALVLESAEIGDNGGLVLLFGAMRGKVMEHVDDLMTGVTGSRGRGDEDLLQWSDDRVTAVAQRVAKKYVALAVTSGDPCRDAPAPATAPAAAAVTGDLPPATDMVPPPEDSLGTTSAAAAAAVVAAIRPTTAGGEANDSASAVDTIAIVETSAPEMDFEVIGVISHEAADRTWVDVMGVVANHTDTSYRLATFDVALFSRGDELICVDTISVSVLKAGQERAFRDAVRCPNYEPETVARVELQFAGGI